MNVSNVVSISVLLVSLQIIFPAFYARILFLLRKFCRFLCKCVGNNNFLSLDKETQIAVRLRLKFIDFITLAPEFRFVRNLPEVSDPFRKDQKLAALLLRYGKKILIRLAVSVFVVIPLKRKILPDVNRTIGFVHSNIVYHNYGTSVNSFLRSIYANTQ